LIDLLKRHNVRLHRRRRASAPGAEVEKEHAAATRLAHALQQMRTARPHLPQVVSHLASDGWYAKKKYLDAVVAEGLHLVTKLRVDANMRFRYTGERTG